MNIKPGDKFEISGMILEVVTENGDNWETLNTTTSETVFMNKEVLEKAVKLGKANVISDSE